MNRQIPSLAFVFPSADQDIPCTHCGQLIDYRDGRPIAVWGMNGAPLHRPCAEAYIEMEGWESPTGLNIYRQKNQGLAANKRDQR